jgi:hypothetical protein
VVNAYCQMSIVIEIEIDNPIPYVCCFLHARDIPCLEGCSYFQSFCLWNSIPSEVSFLGIVVSHVVHYVPKLIPTHLTNPNYCMSPVHNVSRTYTFRV